MLNLSTNMCYTSKCRGVCGVCGVRCRRRRPSAPGVRCRRRRPSSQLAGATRRASALGHRPDETQIRDETRREVIMPQLVWLSAIDTTHFTDPPSMLVSCVIVQDS